LLKSPKTISLSSAVVVCVVGVVGLDDRAAEDPVGDRPGEVAEYDADTAVPSA
jgi:hypothetical protein